MHVDRLCNCASVEEFNHRPAATIMQKYFACGVCGWYLVSVETYLVVDMTGVALDRMRMPLRAVGV